jgi:hypothetical protein
VAEYIARASLPKKKDYWDDDFGAGYDQCLDDIAKIPAADVRPVVRATWEKVMEQPYLRKHYHVVACSSCHKRGNQGWKYCPNCGARMEES